MKIKSFNRILIISVLILGLSLSPVFAATQVDQESLYPLLKLPSDYFLTTYNNGTTYMYRNNGVGYALGILGQVISRSLYQVISNTSNIYSSVDGVEGSLSTISGKIKDYTSYLDGLEDYVDGLESALGTNNSRLQSILTAVQGITTYNYNSVLNSILANTNYLPTIESDLQVTNDALGTSNTGIWGAASGISHFAGLISSDTSSILSGLFNWSWNPTVSYYEMSSYGNSIIDTSRYLSKKDISGIKVPLVTYRNNLGAPEVTYNTVSTFSGMLFGLNSNLVQLFQSVYTNRSVYPDITYYSDGSGVTVGESSRTNNMMSVMDVLYSFEYNTGKLLSDLTFILADADTIQRKKDNAGVTSEALDGFTGSGSAAASVSDISAVKDSVGSLKNATSGGASFSQAFNAFSGDSDGWSWFSQENADAMDTTGSGSRLLRSSFDSSTPYLDAYYSDIFSILGGGDVND